MFNCLSYFNKKPIVVVTCLRDIALLLLQAQSISKQLKGSHDIYIVVNEDKDVFTWNQLFDTYCRQWYCDHNLNILYKKDFDCTWSTNKNIKYQGWDNQQILKLAVSKFIKSKSYLVLDSQNFLIKEWSTGNYPIKNKKVPARNGLFRMSQDTFNMYADQLGVASTTTSMSLSTPIFLKTDMVQTLINNWGDLKDFSKWFFNTSNHVSEFLLYAVWLEKNQGYQYHHYDVEWPWNGPMVRITDTNKEHSLKFFFENIGKNKEAWISITHESWANFNKIEKEKVSNVLKKYNLDIENSGFEYIINT